MIKEMNQYSKIIFYKLVIFRAVVQRPGVCSRTVTKSTRTTVLWAVFSRRILQSICRRNLPVRYGIIFV